MSYPFLEIDVSVASTGVTQPSVALAVRPVASPVVTAAVTPKLHRSVVDLGKQTTG
jgi:hypothetical protein